jgi:hypothetical protein
MISSDVVVLERGDLTVVKTKPNVEPSKVGLYTRHRKQYPALKHYLFNSDVMIILSNARRNPHQDFLNLDLVKTSLVFCILKMGTKSKTTSLSQRITERSSLTRAEKY